MSIKEDQIEKFRVFVNSPLATGSALAGLNMCDIYLNVQDREYVLNTIKYRFPTATENLDTAEDWYEKLSSLINKDSYVNAFVSQEGEFSSVERLEELGKSAKLFGSRIHPDNDIIDSDGIEWSVKSYSENQISKLKSIISDHPGSENYIINSEAYKKLKLNGDLDSLSDKGITILDGQFSHDENFQLGTERLESITGDITDEIYDGIWDDVPAVAGIVTLCNIGLNVSKYYKNEVTENEALADIIRSTSKLTVASGGAAAGGVVGASIGSAIFPLAGTVIGGGVGALLGAIGARGLIDDFIDDYKTQNTNRAYKYFSEKYNNGLDDEILSRFSKRYYFIDQIEKNLTIEKKRIDTYKGGLDISNDIKPTLSAVLIDETINKLEHAIDRIDYSTKDIFTTLINFCIECGISKYPGDREKSKKYAFYLYGSILAENSKWLLPLDKDEKKKIEAMEKELKKYPKNAFTLKTSKEKLLGAIALLALNIKGNKA